MELSDLLFHRFQELPAPHKANYRLNIFGQNAILVQVGIESTQAGWQMDFCVTDYFFVL